MLLQNLYISFSISGAVTDVHVTHAVCTNALDTMTDADFCTDNKPDGLSSP